MAWVPWHGVPWRGVWWRGVPWHEVPWRWGAVALGAVAFSEGWLPFPPASASFVSPRPRLDTFEGDHRGNPEAIRMSCSVLNVLWT